jgi:hypothetical protein
VVAKIVKATSTPEIVPTGVPTPAVKVSFFSGPLAKIVTPLVAGGILLVVVSSVLYLITKKKG